MPVHALTFGGSSPPRRRHRRSPAVGGKGAARPGGGRASSPGPPDPRGARTRCAAAAASGARGPELPANLKPQAPSPDTRLPPRGGLRGRRRCSHPATSADPTSRRTLPGSRPQGHRARPKSAQARPSHRQVNSAPRSDYDTFARGSKSRRDETSKTRQPYQIRVTRPAAPSPGMPRTRVRRNAGNNRLEGTHDRYPDMRAFGHRARSSKSFAGDETRGGEGGGRARVRGRLARAWRRARGRGWILRSPRRRARATARDPTGCARVHATGSKTGRPFHLGMDPRWGMKERGRDDVDVVVLFHLFRASFPLFRRPRPSAAPLKILLHQHAAARGAHLRSSRRSSVSARMSAADVAIRAKIKNAMNPTTTPLSPSGRSRRPSRRRRSAKADPRRSPRCSGTPRRRARTPPGPPRAWPARRRPRRYDTRRDRPWARTGALPRRWFPPSDDAVLLHSHRRGRARISNRPAPKELAERAPRRLWVAPTVAVGSP